MPPLALTSPSIPADIRVTTISPPIDSMPLPMKPHRDNGLWPWAIPTTIAATMPPDNTSVTFILATAATITIR